MNLPLRHILIERRAALISDPVERLRYLRRTMEGPPSMVIRVAAKVLTPEFWKTGRSWILFGLAVLTIGVAAWRPGHSTVNAAPTSVQRAATPANLSLVARVTPPPGKVWLVDSRNGVENYSNGLRIDDKYQVSNQPRPRYAVYAYTKKGLGIAEWKTMPSGIVYHTTESLLAPFEPGQNRRLMKIGSAVLEFVQKNLAYHFLIDRFGRVFRVVRESDTANHAGMSVWGDEKGAYINLNSSFLGIAFESATDADPGASIATPAQIHSARVLTEMLRSKYDIAAADCVTHAQVSVNPSNMLIGYHTDWGGSFPYAEMGLPDNYASPPVSLSAFGFGYDDTYMKITGNRMGQALVMAKNQMEHQAATSGLPVSKYKASLQQRYREITAALKSSSPGKEKGDEI